MKNVNLNNVTASLESVQDKIDELEGEINAADSLNRHSIHDEQEFPVMKVSALDCAARATHFLNMANDLLDEAYVAFDPLLKADRSKG